MKLKTLTVLTRSAYAPTPRKMPIREEGADLLNLLDGDEFITEDQRRKVDAQERRLLRKQRLQRAQVVDTPISIKLELDNATNTGTTYHSSY
jgi:hypothetical protein